MKRKILKLIKYNPVKIARLVGFKDMTDLHNKWLREMIFEHDDKTILAHRGSYKTSCLSVAIALLMVLYPKKHIIFLRKTDDDVIEVIKQVANILSTPVFLRIVKELYDIELQFTEKSSFKINTNLSITTKGAVQLLGIGIGGSLTGKHADIVITDDIVNIKDRISRADREKTKLIYMELQNVKNRGGRILNTGTPWHKEDAISTMPNVETYDCYSTGLIDRKTLEQIRSKMTPSLFAANYEMKHIADADALFKNPVFFDDEKLLFNGISHIDASYGGEDGTAYTNIKEKDGLYYVLGKRWDKHVDDCLNEIYLYQAKYRTGTIHCEKNGDKGYLKKEIQEDGLLCSGYNEKMNKYVKITTYLRSNWDKIRFHVDSDPEYINEILDYTENAAHDDAPDSLASILRNMTSKGKWIT